MDLINLHNDGTFDSGPQPVSDTTGAAWIEIARLQPRSRRTLTSIIVGLQTIGAFRILQSAFKDDPFPQVVVSGNASGNGFASPALSDLSYVIPVPSFPMAAGMVFQAHFQGDAYELIFQAQLAGGTSPVANVRVMGSTNGIGTL